MRNVFICCWVSLFVCQLSLIACLFKAPALTYSLFVLHLCKCPSVFLQHLIRPNLAATNVQMSECPSVSFNVAFVTQDHQTWQRISVSWNYSLFSFILIIRQKFNPQSSLVGGFYHRDSQIVGVLSTLQLWAVIHIHFAIIVIHTHLTIIVIHTHIFYHHCDS